MALTQGQVNEILKIISQNDTNPQDVVTLLLKEPLNVSYVVAYIRKGLITAVQYENTLNLLSQIVLSFSKDVLNDHLAYFMDTVIGNRKDCLAKFKFLEISVRYIAFNDVMSKQPLGVLIGKIVEKCISVEMYSNIEYESLCCLQVCLELYPGSCNSHRNKLEKYITGYLKYDKHNKFIIGKAAKCFHYLQQCGPNPHDIVQNWKNALIKVSSTIKELLKCSSNDQYNFTESDDLFPLNVANEANTKFFLLECRLECLIKFLAALIETKFQQPKVFKPDLIISLLDFQVNDEVTDENSPSIESYLSNTIKIRVETQLFRLFKSFIAMLGVRLIPFSNKITKILLEKLNETRNTDHKKALYNLIGYFVSVLKNNVSSLYHKRLLELILMDTVPILKNVTLNVANVSSLKTRQKITAQKTIQRKSTQNNENCSNLMTKEEDLCISGLDCLKTIFNNLNLVVKPVFLKSVYKTISDTLTAVQNGFDIPPYSSVKSIAMLYQVLVASLEQTHPPNLTIVINLLKTGLSVTDNDEILNICTNGLKIIEKICQPTRPLVFSYNSFDNINQNQENGRNRESYENQGNQDDNTDVEIYSENLDNLSANIQLSSIECKSDVSYNGINISFEREMGLESGQNALVMMVDSVEEHQLNNVIDEEMHELNDTTLVNEDLNNFEPEARVVLEKLNESELNRNNQGSNSNEDITLEDMLNSFHDSPIQKQ